MAIDALVRHWTGTAYRHIPFNAAHDVRDFRFAGQAPNNRWNVAGEPTLYLAGDPGVAVAEFARNMQLAQTSAVGLHAARRQLYRLEVAVDLLDLRDAEVLAALSIAGAPGRFLDRAVARATAQFIRTTTAARAILVPSMAFLDQPERWSLVLFLERLPQNPDQFITAAAPFADFSLTPADFPAEGR